MAYLDIHDQAKSINRTFAVVIPVQLGTLVLATVVTAWHLYLGTDQREWTEVGGSKSYFYVCCCVVLLSLTMIFAPLFAVAEVNLRASILIQVFARCVCVPSRVRGVRGGWKRCTQRNHLQRAASTT